MPTQKKVWVFDGAIEQYVDNYLTTIHGQQACTSCHGGNASGTTRAAAHDNTWKAIPGSGRCSACHAAIVTASATSLHTNLGGYVKVLGDRGFNFMGPTQATRFDEQCTKCHAANGSTEAACGFCHVSVPVTAGGGLLNGHNFRITPDMERNCTACHGSRVKDEFFGSNNALITRNGLGLAAVQPDVHFAQTQAIDNATGLPYGCTFCHGEAEMHGTGAPAPAGTGTRYDVAGAPKCEDCHSSLTGSNTLHSAGHLATMACQVCHSQPYKNCFGCHTDVDVGGTGLPFYTINAGDPTLAGRGAGATPDSLMTFRIGKNPLWLGSGDTAHRKYSVLRHVPVDNDVFTYVLGGAVPGLIPDMTANPTWKFATPHNIQRVSTSFTVSDCNNCHAAAYSAQWLTDPVANSHGWLDNAYAPDEVTANDNVTQLSAPPMAASP